MTEKKTMTPTVQLGLAAAAGIGLLLLLSGRSSAAPLPPETDQPDTNGHVVSSASFFVIQS